MEPTAEAENELIRIARLFRQRDDIAVEELNAHIATHGVSIEARLAFAEARLADVASLLVGSLEKIADMQSSTSLSKRDD